MSKKRAPGRSLDECEGEIHHLSGVWKSIFRFLRNHDSGKNGIAFFLKPYNDVMHFIV